MVKSARVTMPCGRRASLAMRLLIASPCSRVGPEADHTFSTHTFSTHTLLRHHVLNTDGVTAGGPQGETPQARELHPAPGSAGLLVEELFGFGQLRRVQQIPPNRRRMRRRIAHFPFMAVSIHAPRRP